MCQWKPSVYRDLLAEFIDELNLLDVLRIKNPGKKAFYLRILKS